MSRMAGTEHVGIFNDQRFVGRCGGLVPTGLASLCMGSGGTEPLPEHILY